MEACTTPLPLAVEEFLSWLVVEKGRSPNTLAAYRRDLTAYHAWLGERTVAVDAVGERDIEDYVAHQRALGRAASSTARAMVVVRTFHRFCADEGRAPHDPAADVAVPRVPAGLPKPLTEVEVEALIGSVTGGRPLDRRDRAVLEILYGTGVRISELVGMSLGDVDLAGRSARVRGKGAKERLVPLGRVAVGALGEWLEPAGRAAMAPERWARRGDAEAMFLNVRGGRLSRQGAWAMVRAHGAGVGLGERLSPHVLRHSCATHMLDHGADIRVVQELLGHASISTTQVYTKVSAERLRAVYEAAHPRARGRPASTRR